MCLYFKTRQFVTVFIYVADAESQRPAMVSTTNRHERSITRVVGAVPRLRFGLVSRNSYIRSLIPSPPRKQGISAMKNRDDPTLSAKSRCPSLPVRSVP